MKKLISDKKLLNNSVLVISEDSQGYKALGLERGFFKKEIVLTVSAKTMQQLMEEVSTIITGKDFLPQQVIFCPGTEKYLQQSFILPSAVAVNLQGAVTFELQKHYPFKLDQISTSFATSHDRNTAEAAQAKPEEIEDDYILISSCAVPSNDFTQSIEQLDNLHFSTDYACPLMMLIGGNLKSNQASLLVIKLEDGSYLVGLYKHKLLIEASLITSANSGNELADKCQALCNRHRSLLGIENIGHIFLDSATLAESENANQLGSIFGVQPHQLSELAGDELDISGLDEKFLPLFLCTLQQQPESLNLLKNIQSNLRVKKSTKIIAGLVASVVVAALLIPAYIYMAKKIRISRIEHELDELAPQLQTINKLRSENTQNKLLIKRSRELAAGNISALRIIKDVSELFPEHTFLTRIAYSKSKNELNINGMSMDIDELEELVSDTWFIDNSKIFPPKIRNKFFEYFIFNWTLTLKHRTYEQLANEGYLSENPPSSMLPQHKLIKRPGSKGKTAPARKTSPITTSAPAGSEDSEDNADKPAANASAETSQDDTEKPVTQQEVNEIFNKLMRQMFANLGQEPMSAKSQPEKNQSTSPVNGSTNTTDATDDDKDKKSADEQDDDNLGWPLNQ